ncbi:arginine/serine-rich protein 1 [Nerophis ophidion]|uniref:arginine/serine-rich protein 1 n=1 Tax=Nerophis ophidion TaxID=159077 RepID=UPI002ADF10FB|nr:arginine/serine-rich protein 1 [Nerophis ophidion]XP_061751614.1 arginine/serine-rich protein 1 [Nerophis ophidion]
MTKRDECNPMAHSFDKCSPSSHCSSSGSSPSSTSGSNKGKHRSSSCSSGSSSRSRSRSHPRCHRHSHCRGHRKYSRDRRHPSRSHRAHSRSYSRSPSPDRYRRHSSSRCSFGWKKNSTTRRRFDRLSKSPSTSYSRSSASSGRSGSLSLEDKRQLLKTAKVNAIKQQRAEKLELPKHVKPILPEEPDWGEPITGPWVRPLPEKMWSQNNEVEPTMATLKIFPKSKTITFNINNCVVKPTVTSPSSASITANVDSYEGRRPYGHWIPVMSSARKPARYKSH